MIPVRDPQRKEKAWGMDTSESPYLTCADVARRWCCSKSTVYRRIRAGHLETIGQRALLRVTRESMIRYEAEIKRHR